MPSRQKQVLSTPVHF